MAVFVVSVGVSSIASALPTAGPFWQVNGTQLAVGTSKAITAKGSTATFYSTIGGRKVKITCAKVESKGAFIYNTATQGESQETLVFEKECKEAILNNKQEYIVQSGCEISTPITFTQVVDGLWYHTRVNSQRSGATERTATEQLRIAPKTGRVFTTITITENPECAQPLNAAPLEGSFAGEIKPEQTEVLSGKLIFPSEQQKHVWRPASPQAEETQLGLTLGKEEMRFEGEATVELESKERFGTIE
jgi:hypothetical protein